MTWQPGWLPNTAYAVTAVVIPTTFAGFTWRCTTGGTSGAVEPTWPVDPSITPTIADGSVTWSVGTGFRQAVQNGIVSIVQTFSNANNTIIRQVLTARRGSWTENELPLFYLGDMNETVATANGVRTRTFAGFSAFLIDRLGESLESNDRMNFVVDALTDLFTLNVHAAGGRAIFQHTGTNDLAPPDSGTYFVGAEFTFAETKLAEGRD